MEFSTKVSLPKDALTIKHSQQLLVMGSCFAEHIGARLLQGKFPCMVNPFGILYNPLSIAHALQMMHEGKTFTDGDMHQFADGGWNSWMHHSRFSCPDKDEALAHINVSLQQATAQLSSTQRLLVTWGTSWVYRLRENGEVVGNCHKSPDRLFVRSRLTVDEIVDTYSALLQRLWQRTPTLKVLFTVSPVRHLKDGAHGNQLSKAVLLLAADTLCQRYPEQCFYFPSYEIVLDELRDYRFYADDMAHPSAQAIRYVWECFSQCYFDDATQRFLDEWNKVEKALSHRPFHPEAEEYQTFVRQTLLKIQELKDKMPYLEVQNELDTCHILLNRSHSA